MLNHIGTQTIEPDRLILRKYKLADAEYIYRNWVTDAEASRFWGWEQHKNIEETIALLTKWIDEYCNNNYYHWVIVLTELSQAIGYVYLNEINSDEKSASIHYLVSRRFWNHGIMTEACKAVLAFSFSCIEIERVYTHHHVDNPASGKVMIKSGMRYIETKSKQIPDCTQISGDYCFYEITRNG